MDFDVTSLLLSTKKHYLRSTPSYRFQLRIPQKQQKNKIKFLCSFHSVKKTHVLLTFNFGRIGTINSCPCVFQKHQGSKTLFRITSVQFGNAFSLAIRSMASLQRSWASEMVFGTLRRFFSLGDPACITLDA